MKCENCKYADMMKYVGMNDSITYCTCEDSVFYQMTISKNMSCAKYEDVIRREVVT